MNSIHDDVVSLDTNVFVFALRKDPTHPACETLLYDRLEQLNVYIPLQVLVELQRNLTDQEMHGVLLALTKAKAVRWDYTPAPAMLVTQWQQRGAKKGDAVIVAHLAANAVPYLISENRHFLVEVPDLPFQVLTSEQAVQLLN